jgi:O-antigen/teichoic acid export membrane protein
VERNLLVVQDIGIDRRKLFFSTLWSAAGSWGRQFLSLLILIVSARLLSPSEIGLISIPAVLLMVKESSLDWALNETLVRRLELTSAQLTSAFWFSVLIGTALAVLLVAVGNWIGSVIGEPAFAEINAALAVCYPLAGAATVFEAKLRRDLDFHVLAIRPLVALAIAGIISVGMILAGFGVWALVAQIVIEKLVGCLLLLRVGHWLPGISLSWSHVRTLLPDFLNIAGAQFLSQGARNLDRLVVGLFFAPAAMGAYMLACRVVETATTLLLQGANKVAYVLFARLQGENEQLLIAFNKASKVTAFIAVPAFVGLSLLAPDVVEFMFGPQWELAGHLLQILVLTGIPQVIAGYTDSITRATGKANWFLANMGISGLVAVIFLMLVIQTGSTHMGPMVIAAVPLVREATALFVGLLIVRSVLNAPVSQLLRCMLPIIFSVLVMGLLIEAARPAVTENFGQPGDLFICILLGMLTYASSILLTARPSLLRTWAFVRELR